MTGQCIWNKKAEGAGPVEGRRARPGDFGSHSCPARVSWACIAHCTFQGSPDSGAGAGLKSWGGGGGGEKPNGLLGGGTLEHSEELPWYQTDTSEGRSGLHISVHD